MASAEDVPARYQIHVEVDEGSKVVSAVWTNEEGATLDALTAELMAAFGGSMHSIKVIDERGHGVAVRASTIRRITVVPLAPSP